MADYVSRPGVEVVDIPTGRPPAQVDVLVVGAGPSGLGTALELRRHGVDVAVVDAATEATLARAGAFGHSARTVEFFRQWGVVDRIRSEWTFPPEWNHGTLLVTSLAGHELTGSRRDFVGRPAAPDSFEVGIRRPQTVLQKVFLEKLVADGVPVTGGWRAAGLETDFDEVRVEVQAEAGESAGRSAPATSSRQTAPAAPSAAWRASPGRASTRRSASSVSWCAPTATPSTPPDAFPARQTSSSTTPTPASSPH